MPLIEYPSRDAVTDEAREILEAWEAEHGSRSQILESLARHPPAMDAFMHFFDRVMHDGSVDRQIKELIAVVVSVENNCDYCTTSHSATLTDVLEAPAGLVDAVQAGNYGDLPQPERAAAALASKATRDPHRVMEEDLGLLREQGFDDQQLVELLGVVCLFQAANTYVDTLTLLPSDFGE